MRVMRMREALLLMGLWGAALMSAGASDAIQLQGGTVDPDGETVWYDARQLGIEGKGWEERGVRVVNMRR